MEFSENVSIAWYRQNWLEKCVVLLASNCLKMSAWFDNDMKFGKVCGIVSQ